MISLVRRSIPLAIDAVAAGIAASAACKEIRKRRHYRLIVGMPAPRLIRATRRTLTLGEIADLIGCSIRKVHLLAAGGDLSRVQLERLQRIAAIERNLPGRTHKARRAALMTNAADGTSVWTRLRAEFRNRGQAVAS